MTIHIRIGDCRDVLPGMPDRSVHCCVTSPPYFGLRDYGEPAQIGLEPTPEAYVDEMVEVFRDVRRVLRDDGTLWLNIGDSYASAGGHSSQGSTSARNGRANATTQNAVRGFVPTGHIKQKDLIGIPWMLAFALRADGWYLRAENIWAKRNGTPESVTDRTTRNHEQVFLLSKSPKYFFDHVAIQEPGVIPAGTRAAKASNTRSDAYKVNGRPPEYWEYTGTRNARSVWHHPTFPFPGAHFATMPPVIAEICIKAGTSEGGACPTCGTQAVRILAGKTPASGLRSGNTSRTLGDDYGRPGAARARSFPYEPSKHVTQGWARQCACDDCGFLDRPIVLDPFGGAGTTAMVADRLGRDSIMIEMSPSFARMAEARIRGDAGMLCRIEVTPAIPA